MNAIYYLIAAAILISFAASNPVVMGYTLDANLAKTDSMFKAMELKNIKISDLPKSLKASNATLVNSYGDKVRIYVNPTSISFTGKLAYQTSDGSKNFAFTMFVPDITKVKGNVYTLKDVLGTHGTMILNGESGTLHLEGINDPKAES